MDPSIVDDLIVALDRALHDGGGKLNTEMVVAELARADLTVRRKHLTDASGDGTDDIYAALARLHEFTTRTECCCRSILSC
jgi:hypothetical protein